MSGISRRRAFLPRPTDRASRSRAAQAADEPPGTGKCTDTEQAAMFEEA